MVSMRGTWGAKRAKHVENAGETGLPDAGKSSFRGMQDHDRAAPGSMGFAPGVEFTRIGRMFGAAHFSVDGRGLGDDAYVWEPAPGQVWVATTDASAEGTHFRLDWIDPARAARKCLLASLSDVNAMGGTARLAFFCLGARAAWDDATYEAIGAAVRELESRHGFVVAGGDTTVAREGAFFSFTVLGQVAGQPLLRASARPGHRIYVSGALGGSAAWLDLRGVADARLERALEHAHFDPEPPLALGPALAALGRPSRPLAAIDISDGLSSELWHLARRSGCALTVDLAAIPAHPALAGQPAARLRDWVLHGGEEYQLVFTGNFTDAELDALRVHAPITEIGEVTAGEGVFLRDGDTVAPLPAKGYVHGGSEQ